MQNEQKPVIYKPVNLAEIDYEHLSGFFTAYKGKECFWQAWIADPSFRRNLVIHHGLGEHSGRYGNILTTFAGEKLNIFTYDMRGHGNSRGPSGDIKDIDELVCDLDIFLGMLEKESHVIKPVLYGHSLGGLVVLSFALRHTNQCHLQALAVNAAALRPMLTMPQRIKAVIGRMLYLVWPHLLLSSGLSARNLSHDPEVIHDYLNDPLVHDRISLSLARSLIDSGEAVLSRAAQLQIPVLVTHGQEDRLVDSSGSVELYREVSAKEKQVSIYPGLYHETFNEFPVERQSVLEELRQWVLNHIPMIKVRQIK